ncbi:MAG TPA: hypothetical protein VFS59_15955 [Gemmatimonadaceae bacterium]|nr:hypothetical protein [Gemmatimonadaceae bacterium]
MSGGRPLAFVLAVLVAGSGCLPVRRSEAEAPVPTAASEWPAVYVQAMTDAREARLAAAEKSLTDFAQRFPGTAEAAEVPYWRALLKLDPANPTGMREAIALLDTYLASTPSGAHRTEATTLRRLVVALEQRSAAVAATTPAAAPRPEDKAREEEMQHLRDELAKANAELDRIRRRLARPRP